MKGIKYAAVVAVLGLFQLLNAAYSQAVKNTSVAGESEEFKGYWYGGMAEITSYKLEQARYGELHEGYSVLVFVTEDFSVSKRVKLEDTKNAEEEGVKVLKLNRIKKFDTGIYSYSMMDSVFTPVKTGEYPNSLKVSSSSQDWCGHTFVQLNINDIGYEVQAFSYFESEGDRKFNLENEILEDELWSRIRLDPRSLPLGKIRIIPAAMASRLTHRDLKVETAQATLTKNKDDSDLLNYRLVYDDSGRSIVIMFNKFFPYEIQGWEETYKSGFGGNAKTLTTKATKNKTLISNYWNKNSPEDLALRKELGL